MVKAIDDFQKDVASWHRHNFGAPNQLLVALKVAEEAGELAGAVVKGAEPMRDTAHWDLKAQDAVGDTIIALAMFCNARGLSLEHCVRDAWEEVRGRDFVLYPFTGRPPTE